VGDVLDVDKKDGAGEVNLRAKRTAQSGAEQRPSSNREEGDDNVHHSLNVVVKADVLGSLEAIIASLEKLKNEEVAVKVVGKGLGNINADDVSLAQSTGAVIYGFSVHPSPVSQEMIGSSGVEFIHYRVIYDLLDNVKERLEKLLNPEVVITELGNFKVVAIFRTDKNFMILGGRVEMGKLKKNCQVR